MGAPEELVEHKVFPGNRPSNVLLFDALTPRAVGQLLALYEQQEDYRKVRDIQKTLLQNWPKARYWKSLAGAYTELGEDEKLIYAYDAAHTQGMLEKDTEFVTMAQLYLQAEVPYKAATLMQEKMDAGIVPKNEKPSVFVHISSPPMVSEAASPHFDHIGCHHEFEHRAVHRAEAHLLAAPGRREAAQPTHGRPGGIGHTGHGLPVGNGDTEFSGGAGRPPSAERRAGGSALATTSPGARL